MSRIDDGFSTTVTFFTSAITLIWEKGVTPPGLEAGGPIDTTTMRNTAWRTMSPKQLKTLTEMAFTAAYDPACYDEVVAALGVNQKIRVNFPDGSHLEFWGWLDVFEPGEVEEGDQPEADVTIIPSNHDLDNVEVAPLYIGPTGTAP